MFITGLEPALALDTQAISNLLQIHREPSARWLSAPTRRCQRPLSNSDTSIQILDSEHEIMGLLT